MEHLMLNVPEEKDDFELYVSECRKRSGMSVSGLSRFIGVDRRAMSRTVLDKLENPGTSDIPKSLEPFVGNAYDPGLCEMSGGNTKIIPARTCEAIIFYYAFESTRISKQVKENAVNAYRKFAQYGLHQYICNLVGCIDEKNDRELLSLVKEVLSEVKELRQVATEYKVIREKTTTYLPGADDLLDEIKDGNLLPCSSGKVSLERWLFDKGVQLSEKQFRRLAHIVCDTYRSLTKQDPEKAHCKVNGKVKYNVSVFRQEHFPILQIGLNKLLA